MNLYVTKTEFAYHELAITALGQYPIYTGVASVIATLLVKYSDVPTFGIYTLSYEHILCLFKSKEDRSRKTTVTSQVVAGGIAGILSWVLVAPLDVIKSKLQADDFGQPVYSGMIDCFKKVYQQEGTRGLFLGTVLMTVRAFPVNAATFVGYEYTIRLCDDFVPKLTSGLPWAESKINDGSMSFQMPKEPPDF